MKVLVSDPLSKNGLELLKKNKFEVTEIEPAQLKEEIKKGYDALIVRSGSKVTEEVINNSKGLKVIGRAGVGVDNVDVEAATKKGIVVMNTPGGNTLSTAEHTMALILSLARNIPQAYKSMIEGRWDRKKFKGIELSRKTLGIIGLGRIGTEVAKRAKSFEMRVLVYDPFLSDQHAAKLDVEVSSLDAIFSESDIITVHTPINDETRNLINKDTISKMKEGVRIINCARGGIIDEDALYDALKKGKVAGAAIDVYASGEPPTDKKLFELDNVVLTPHLGASTAEAQENVALGIAEQIVEYFVNNKIVNAVNAPSIDPEVFKLLKPYILLGEKIGKLLSSLVAFGIENIKITYSGDVADLNTAPVTSSVLKGLFEKVQQEPVNEVNAPGIAKERGIKVVESKTTRHEDFATLIDVSIEGKGTKVSAAGSLFAHNADPRIVKINDFRMDMVPFGNVLIVHNSDIPGMIGFLGTVLGENKVNIAGMSVGRHNKGKTAMTVINVDNAVSEKAISGIKKNKNIIDVKLVKF
ncbi:phosphoglycerate dehydrogenase [bacterium]|jgi:D-3-phosphoglycerate dehydrogenase|nr:phosphoglycerate dehydrogenase [bacterium]